MFPASDDPVLIQEVDIDHIIVQEDTHFFHESRLTSIHQQLSPIGAINGAIADHIEEQSDLVAFSKFHKELLYLRRTNGMDLFRMNGFLIAIREFFVLMEGVNSEIPQIRTPNSIIGQGQAPYLIAEIGLNHNGSSDLAIRMIEEAAKSGAQGVKFQIFEPELLIHSGARLGEGDPGSLREFFSSFALKKEDWIRLKGASERLGVDFLASVFDGPSLELYLELNPPLIKIASSEITNHDLFYLASRANLPVAYATGASEEKEVADAYHSLARTDTVILQCVSSYPADPADYNLKLLEQWRARYTPLVGLSDHTVGIEVSLGAVALGAVLIERHFTIDRNLEGPDQKLSLTPGDFAELAKGAKILHGAMGTGIKVVTDQEAPVRSGGRRGLYARRLIRRGSILQKEDVIALRPGGEIPVDRLSALVGKTASRDIEELQLLKWEDFLA